MIGGYKVTYVITLINNAIDVLVVDTLQRSGACARLSRFHVRRNRNTVQKKYYLACRTLI